MTSGMMAPSCGCWKSQTRPETVAAMRSAKAACLRVAALRVEDDDGLAGGDAVGVGQLLVDDVVAAQRHGEEEAEDAGGGEPEERLPRRRREVEVDHLRLAQEVERREEDAHERRLRRRGAGGLDDVVLPAVEVAEEDAEHQVAEERGHHRDVRPEAELQDDVRVGGAHDRRDDEAGSDGAWREFAHARRLLAFFVLCHGRQVIMGPWNRS